MATFKNQIKQTKQKIAKPDFATRVTCDRMTTLLGTGIVFNIIGLRFVFWCVKVFCVLSDFIFVLFMHYIKLFHASHVLIFESTHKLYVRWGTNNLPYDLSQGLSLCKSQLFAERPSKWLVTFNQAPTIV